MSRTYGPTKTPLSSKTYRYRNMHSTGKPGDDDKHHHAYRELRERRQGEEVIPEEADRVGPHIPTVLLVARYRGPLVGGSAGAEEAPAGFASAVSRCGRPSSCS